MRRVALLAVLAALSGALVIGPSIAVAAAAQIETTIELDIAPKAVNYGQTMHVKVTVRPNSGTETPPGVVTMWTKHQGFSQPLWEGAVPNGVVEVDVRPDVGTFAIRADFRPNDEHRFRYGTTTSDGLSVGIADSTTTVSAEPEATGPGEPVKLTAKISPVFRESYAQLFEVDFTDGDVKLGFCNVQDLASAQCSITTDKLPLGKRTVTANFTGNSNLKPSSATTTVHVRMNSTTTLSATPNPATEKAELALTAQVAGADPKITAPFAGKVTFTEGTTELGTGEVNKDGKATLRTSKLTVGTHQLTARFGGSDALEPSTSEKITVQVDAAPPPVQGGDGGTPGTSGGGAGNTPQATNLPLTGVSLGLPLGIGAALLILGAVGVTLGRRRRRLSR